MTASVTESFRSRAALAPRHIVLPEGHDPRVQLAAVQAVALGLGPITLLTRDAAEAAEACLALAAAGGGAALGGALHVIDAATAADLPQLADHWQERRRKRGLSGAEALAQARDPMLQAALRVALGLADGTVGGAVATTAETVRCALQAIGTAPGQSLVSSFFVMELPEDRREPGQGNAMVFADCGLVIEPSAAELADIALQSAASARALLDVEPVVAMLSFSTAGSAEHESLHRIREAVVLVRAADPGLRIDGEFQFDAAYRDAVRATKFPGSVLDRRPNVFVFHNLAAGNIGYKIAQHIGGMRAVGPILQGLRLPANDLSRAATVEDIIDTIAITTLQLA